MGSIKEPKEPDLRMPWTFMIIFGICAVIVSSFLSEPYTTIFFIMAGLSVRRLGLAFPEFWSYCKTSLNNWAKK